MNIQDAWEKALKKTEIIRPRVQPLHTFEQTHVPYTFLAQSSMNRGDTVVRKGEVVVEKPSIVLPFNMPQFDGFDFEEGMHLNEELMKTFFLVRGVQFPSFKYNNKTSFIDIHEGKLPAAVDFYSKKLAQEEDVRSGLVIGPEECWQFSVIIFVCGQVARSADSDVRRLFDDYKKFDLN